MIGSSQDQLRLLSLFRELDEDALVTITACSLDRRTFEQLPGLEEDGPVLGTWLKRLTIGPISVELYTNEAPAEIIAFPPRPGELRVIEGGRA